MLWVDGKPPVRRSLEEEGILYEDRSQHCLGQSRSPLVITLIRTSLWWGHWRCELVGLCLRTVASQHCLGQEQESFGDESVFGGDFGDVNLWDCVVAS